MRLPGMVNEPGEGVREPQRTRRAQRDGRAAESAKAKTEDDAGAIDHVSQALEVRGRTLPESQWIR